VELTTDVTDQVFPEDDRGETFPAGQERLIELQRALATDAELFQLVDRIARMKGDGRALFNFLADRHEVGERKYGPLDLLNDDRDFEMERAEEFSDSMVYYAGEFVKMILRKRGRR
jgi:hypothetical protein